VEPDGDVVTECACHGTHSARRIVLTGGPGAGKTATIELIRQYFCSHVKVLPESASIVFGGGFPRGTSDRQKRAAQRAIFHVQTDLEEAGLDGEPAILLCDRGTIDGAAYWPGPEAFWSSVGTTLQAQLARYDAVIHLRTPSATSGYNHQNPLRTESALEASVIDGRVAAAWAQHPRRFVVDPAADFLAKARVTLGILRELLPACCRAHVVPPVDASAKSDATAT
jgi:predicted ATPase